MKKTIPGHVATIDMNIDDARIWTVGVHVNSYGDPSNRSLKLSAASEPNITNTRTIIGADGTLNLATVANHPDEPEPAHRPVCRASGSYSDWITRRSFTRIITWTHCLTVNKSTVTSEPARLSADVKTDATGSLTTRV